MSRSTRSTADLPESQGPLFNVFAAIEEQAARATAPEDSPEELSYADSQSEELPVAGPATPADPAIPAIPTISAIPATPATPAPVATDDPASTASTSDPAEFHDTAESVQSAEPITTASMSNTPPISASNAEEGGKPFGLKASQTLKKPGDWHIWKSAMRRLFVLQGVYEVVKGLFDKPEKKEDTNNNTNKPPSFFSARSSSKTSSID